MVRRSFARPLFTTAALALAGLLQGCLFLGFVPVETGESRGGTITVALFPLQRQVTFTADETGCVIPTWTWAECELSGGITPTVCGFAPGADVTMTLDCQDPLLAEWPTSWNVFGLWSAPSVPASGSVLIEPASNFALPAGIGPIVCDPGMSAHVLSLDRLLPPGTEVAVTLVHPIEPLRPNACVKGVDVLVITPPTGPRILVPTEGLGVDFTQIARPGAHSICIGPDTTTAAQRGSWGALKSLYR